MLTRISDYIDLLKFFCLLIIAGNGVALLTGSSSLNSLFQATEELELIFGVALVTLSIPLLLPILKIQRGKLHFLLLPAILILFVTSFASFVQSGYLPEQLIEHSTKLLTPVLFFHCLTTAHINVNRLIFALKILVALTFIGHGLYALGVHYIPEGFIEMTTKILGISVFEATVFLRIIGILDIVCAILILTNFKVRIAYLYLILWGFATALARMIYGLLIHEEWYELFYWFSNMVYRLPYGLIPLIVALYAKSRHVYFIRNSFKA